MTGVPSAIQQPANTVPNVNAGTYLSLASTVVQQPVNSSNNLPGVISVTVQQPASLSNVSSASGVTCVPLRPAVVQQHGSSFNRPPMNTDGSRWIGRGNMNDNNPFCTLPGGVSIKIGCLLFHHSDFLKMCVNFRILHYRIYSQQVN